VLVDPEFAGVISEALTLMTGPKPFVIDVDDAAYGGGKRIGEIEYEATLALGDPDFTARRPTTNGTRSRSAIRRAPRAIPRVS